MKIRVLLFGILAEKAKKNELFLTDIKDVEGLKRKFYESYPGLDKYNFQVSVNRTVTHENPKLKDGDEVALLPPFAGG